MILHVGMDWQPTMTKRGRNITRPNRHYYTDDIQLSSDDEQEVVKAPKRFRKSAGLHAIGNPNAHKTGNGSSGRGLPTKSPPQVCLLSILQEFQAWQSLM